MNMSWNVANRSAFCRLEVGFTLAEMAVVVSIIAILMTMGLSAATSVMLNSQRTASKEKLTFVKDALTAYFLTNKRMPCPDTGSNIGNAGRDGLENRVVGGVNPDVTSACSSSFGTVPYVTLGISRSQALDAYGNFLSYRLDTLRGWHLGNTFNLTLIEDPPGSGTFKYVCQLPGINFPPIPPPTPLAVNSELAKEEIQSAALVVISHGANGLGAWNTGPDNVLSRNPLPLTTNELGNTLQNPAAPAAYRSYVYSDVDANPFDDMLVFVGFGELNTIATKVGKTNICS